MLVTACYRALHGIGCRSCGRRALHRASGSLPSAPGVAGSGWRVVVKPRRNVRPMTKASTLDALRLAVTQESVARWVTDGAAREAIAAGASYGEVGRLLGISRQSAFARYRPDN